MIRNILKTITRIERGLKIAENFEMKLQISDLSFWI